MRRAPKTPSLPLQKLKSNISSLLHLQNRRFVMASIGNMVEGKIYTGVYGGLERNSAKYPKTIWVDGVVISSDGSLSIEEAPGPTHNASLRVAGAWMHFRAKLDNDSNLTLDQQSEAEEEFRKQVLDPMIVEINAQEMKPIQVPSDLVKRLKELFIKTWEPDLQQQIAKMKGLAPIEKYEGPIYPIRAEIAQIASQLFEHPPQSKKGFFHTLTHCCNPNE